MILEKSASIFPKSSTTFLLKTYTLLSEKIIPPFLGHVSFYAALASWVFSAFVQNLSASVPDCPVKGVWPYSSYPYWPSGGTAPSSPTFIPSLKAVSAPLLNH